MLPNLFSTSPVVWSALIAAGIGLPVLIHLINLMRHKKVDWAAMDFLMRSYKKNRNWIWLKQFLLLLSRIAALLLLLFILAQVGCNDDRLTQILGGQTTHHYVLLDDSFSMSDQSGTGTAFDRALATVSKIAAKAKGRENQKLTLIRFSKANDSSGEINGEPVDREFDRRIESFKDSISTTALSVGPAPLLEKITQLTRERSTENSVVYILSDFREKDWTENSELKTAMERLKDNGAQIELIRCVENRRGNLAVTELRPKGNVRVAGVPVTYQLSVKNFGETAAEKIQVRIQTTTFEPIAKDSEPADQDFTIDQLPTVYIEKIEAGETVTREFPVFFPNKGFQAVQAQLPDDALRIDNVRYSSVEFQTTAKVLLIKNESDMNSPFVSLALNPGGLTGLQIESRSIAFLRDARLSELTQFDAVMLLDVETIDPSSVENLQDYVRAGGGLAIFLGPKTNLRTYNEQLYNNGQGLSPFAIDKQIVLSEPSAESPDVTPLDHPLFPGGTENPLVKLVSLQAFYAPPLDWRDNTPKTMSIAATVRADSNWPLIVQRKLGAGNVITFTTTAKPTWNNWARNPSFPPLLLTAQDILASGRYETSPTFTGATIRKRFDIEAFGPNVELLFRANTETGNQGAFERSMAIDGNQYVLGLGVDPLDDITRLPGILDIWLDESDTTRRVERIAINVATEESDLAIANRENLLQAFTASKPKITNWDQFTADPETAKTSDLSKLLLALLLLVMISEQILAYQCSYHAKSGRLLVPGSSRQRLSNAGGRDL